MYFYILVIILVAALLVISFELVKRSKLKAAQLLAVHAFQEEHDLSNRDLKIFKETLGEAKSQIRTAEKAMTGIENEQQYLDSALTASKEIFRYLMDKPKDIVLYDNFLYRSLPAFSNTLERRAAFEQTAIDSSELTTTQKELDKILIELSESIVTDYNRYLKDELEETVIEKGAVKQGDHASGQKE